MTLRSQAPPVALRLVAWLPALVYAVHRYRQAVAGVNNGVDLRNVWAAAQAVVHHGELYHGYTFVYLPSAAVLALPLSVLSFAVAAKIWVVTSYACLLLAPAVVSRALRGAWWVAPLTALVTVGSLPSYGVSVGNVDMVLPLLVALGVMALSREGPRSQLQVAFLTGLGLAVKPLVVVPIAIMAWERRWRCAAIAVAVPVALSVPAVLLTHKASAFFTTTLPAMLRGEDDVIQRSSISVLSVLRDAPPAVQGTARLCVALLCIVTCVSTYRRSAPAAVSWLETVVAGQLGFSLVSSFAFTHHVAVALLLLPSVASSSALVRRPPVLAAVLLLALPRALPGVHDIQQQACAAAALLLLALLTAARLAPSSDQTDVGVDLQRESHLAAKHTGKEHPHREHVRVRLDVAGVGVVLWRARWTKGSGPVTVQDSSEQWTPLERLRRGAAELQQVQHPDEAEEAPGEDTSWAVLRAREALAEAPEEQPASGRFGFLRRVG